MANYLVVGASSGIGHHLAHELAETGHQVYGTWFSHPTVSASERLQYHPLNVLDETISLGFLPESLNGLVYCPGSIKLRPFEKLKAADFISDYQLQTVGAIKIIQAVLPKLKQSGNASVVLFSTLAVKLGLNFHSLVASSKGAVEGLVRSLAAEFAPKIRFNAIAPSLTDTPLASSLLDTEQKREINAQKHPLKRIGNSGDMANMAAFLLSEKASWITGQIFHVDGGMSALRT